MKPLFGYLFLAIGISSGIAANSFAKVSDGFSKYTSLISMYTSNDYYIVLYSKSYVMCFQLDLLTRPIVA